MDTFSSFVLTAPAEIYTKIRILCISNIPKSVFGRKKWRRKSVSCLLMTIRFSGKDSRQSSCETLRYEVVGEAGTAGQGLQMARELKPDLILIDLSLPDQSGIELIRDIHHLSPKIRMMVVSMHSKIDYIVKAFQSGATGYLVKESASEMLMQGIDHVLKGDYYMDPSISLQVVKKLAALPPRMRL